MFLPILPIATQRACLGVASIWRFERRATEFMPAGWDVVGLHRPVPLLNTTEKVHGIECSSVHVTCVKVGQQESRNRGDGKHILARWSRLLRVARTHLR
eukprot:SAG31_NODE_36132_length_316_cov_0.718894_1_plen_98_part_01